MPVRVVSGPGPVPAPTGRRLSRRWLLPAVGLLVGALALGLLLVGGRQQAAPTPTAEQRAAATSESSAPTAGPAAGQAPVGAVGQTSVEGMWTSEVVVGSGNHAAVYGIACGWPHTKEGAAAAAMNTLASLSSLPNLVDATRSVLTARLYTADGASVQLTAAQAARVRQRNRLNDDGVVVLPDGLPSPYERYYGGGMPRYGALRFLTVTPDQVTVEIWMPRAYGTGTDDNLSEVRLGAQHLQVTVRWGDGPGGQDWRVAHAEPLDKRVLETRRSNIGVQGMRDLLGPGWLIPADATDMPYPGAVLAA